MLINRVVLGKKYEIKLGNIKSSYFNDGKLELSVKNIAKKSRFDALRAGTSIQINMHAKTNKVKLDSNCSSNDQRLKSSLNAYSYDDLV